MAKIFIVINPGFFNKGDAAIVLGALKTLRTIDNVEVSLISAYPEFESVRCNANLITDPRSKGKPLIIRIFRFAITILQHTSFAILHRIFGLSRIPTGIMKRGILEEYYKSDIIVAALDDSFTTLYGYAPFSTNFYSIFLAKLLKKSVVLYAGSIGPFKNKFYEILGGYIINKVDLVTLREEISFEYLKKIGVNKPPMYVTADLAFALQPAPLERAKEILSSEGIDENVRPLIGVSLSRVISRWAFPELQDPEEKYRKYIKMMAQMVDYLIEELSATVIFIPQVIGPTEENDDRNTAKDIYQMAKNKDKIKLITNEYTPEELRAITGQFDLFIGARTHSVISAAMMCTPFVAIEYESHKTRGIIGKMLDCDELVYDVRTLDFGTLISKINDAWLNRTKIREELKIKTEGMEERALLNGKLVKELMTRK
ncbi:MAG: polysaccharide pyruvyl transferase family protein [Halobacteriota archaeon]